MNVLLLINELRYTCGVTNHLLHLTRGLSESKQVKLWLICGGGNGIDRFNNINVEVILDKRFLHEERNITNYISAIAFLAKFVTKNKIDIIHSHSHYGANIARNASRLTRTPTIQTNHGLLEKKGVLKHFNAKKYVAINEHIYNYLSEHKIAAKKDISFIRCGIPVPNKIPAKSSSRIKVIAASRFIREKGLDIYIKAVGMLNSETKTIADFYIAGEGELKNELLKLNKETGANISFLGGVKDMYKVFSGCHILVNPSRTGSEGFPAVITEAGANGLLVISSDFRGVESVISHKENGIIFKSEDYNNLSKKLSAAIEKYKSQSVLAENLYKRVKDWFSLDKMINKHLELYKSCLEREKKYR